MSINELEMKIRELRQLQQLIEEAQAEAEGIRDAIKAHMDAQEAIKAGEYNGDVEARQDRQNRHHGPESGLAGGGGPLHPYQHHPPLLRGINERALTRPPFHKRRIRAHNHPGGGQGHCTTAPSRFQDGGDSNGHNDQRAELPNHGDS